MMKSSISFTFTILMFFISIYCYPSVGLSFPAETYFPNYGKKSKTPKVKFSSKPATSKLHPKGLTSKLPLKGSTSKIPLKGSTSKIPSRASTSKLPLKGSTSKIPLKGSTSKLPPKSPAKSMPLRKSSTPQPLSSTSNGKTSSFTSGNNGNGTSSSTRRVVSTSTPAAAISSTSTGNDGDGISSENTGNQVPTIGIAGNSPLRITNNNSNGDENVDGDANTNSNIPPKETSLELERLSGDQEGSNDNLGSSNTDLKELEQERHQTPSPLLDLQNTPEGQSAILGILNDAKNPVVRTNLLKALQNKNMKLFNAIAKVNGLL